MTGVTSVDWYTALDEFEANLDRAEAALADPDAELKPATFVAAAVAEPIPAELRHHAEALLARNAALASRLDAERSRIRAELARLPRRATTERSSTSRFEAQV
ncbi:MAG TPA: hypothetical protein VNC41_10570 [Acidimicrobiia bacterium]|jgi:hypothetical protein|nr:hypothetical protein [Acidimicrobiia bacterium]